MSVGIRAAIEWIALNDDIDIGDEETGYIISICLVADLFDKEQRDIARMVTRKRRKEGMI